MGSTTHQYHAPISRIELLFYAIFLASIVTIGLKNIYNHATELVKDAPDYIWESSKVAGRFIRNHFQDIGDYEWQAFESNWLPFLCCGLVNAAATWVLGKMHFLQWRNWSAAVCGLATMLVTCGAYNTAFFAAEHLAVYATMRISKMPLIFGWLVGAVHMFAPLPPFESEGPFFSGNSYAVIYAMWAWSWNVMRYVSFGSEWQWQLKSKKEDVAENKGPKFTFRFVDFLGYMWYTPSIFASIITYRHFYEHVLGRDQLRSFQIRPFLRQIAVIAFWLIFTLVWGESFMFYTQEQEIADLAALNEFGAGTMTWAHGQYFHAKYMVIYGLPWLVAFLDRGVELTPLPMCISRIYLYSNMWKYFDTGLYDFLKNYIYIPTSRRLGGRFLPAATTFLFIFVWHGLSRGVALWSTCNFAQVVAESILRHACNDPKSWIFRNIRSRTSAEQWRRIDALAGAISFTFSTISNAYFLMGFSAGSYIVSRAFQPKTLNCWVYIITSYTWVQTVFSFENWESAVKI